jgi:hypothetical protein
MGIIYRTGSPPGEREPGASTRQTPYIIFEKPNGQFFAVGVSTRKDAYKYFLADSEENKLKPVGFIKKRCSERDALDLYQKKTFFVSAEEMTAEAEVAEEKLRQLTEDLCGVSHLSGFESYR